MRFSTSFVAALMVSAVVMVAQTAPDQPVVQEQSTNSGSSSNTSVGFKAMYGVGLPSYEGVDVNSETSGAWSVGAFYNWSTSGAVSFAVQPELHYVQESGISVSSVGNLEATTTISSLRLPILAKLQLFDRALIQPSIYAGPSFSYLLSAKNEINGQTEDLDDPTRFQIGLAIGIDVTFLQIFVVDLRYNTKFTKITEVTVANATSSVSMNSLRVGLGLRF